MARRYDAFVVFAEMRTGSNYLEATLNEFTDLHSYGEVYNPVFMGHHKTFEMFGIDMTAREKDPISLFDALVANSEALPGFRFFHDHDPRVLARILPDPRVAKVVLTRNPLDSYVSRKIAAATGQWRLTDMKHQKDAKITFQSDEFEELLQTLTGFQADLQRALQTTGQTAFHIRYEDINDVDVINGLARFLGSSEELSSTSSKLKKQNPSPLSEKVKNYSAMVTALGKLDNFGLDGVPTYEPARHASVPGYIAAPDTGLLFMPIKGSVVDPVVSWMAGLDGIEPEGLLTRMNQKALRQWMRAHPGHRSFSVLRHPVARAYETFNTYILPNDRPAYSDPRRIMRKMYGLPIPENGPDDSYSLEQHKAAFLGFLAILKGNLSGQTSMKVDPAWATQTAVLQGMSGVTFPDILLRETEIAEALPALARGQGHTDAPFGGSLETAPYPLADLYDADVERAAVEVYRRDYLNFGYTDWSDDQAA